MSIRTINMLILIGVMLFFPVTNIMALAIPRDGQLLSPDMDYVHPDVSAEPATVRLFSKDGGAVDWVGYVVRLDAKKEFGSPEMLLRKTLDKRAIYQDEGRVVGMVYAESKSYFRYFGNLSDFIDAATDKIFGDSLTDSFLVPDNDPNAVYMIRSYSGGWGHGSDAEEREFVYSKVDRGDVRLGQALGLNIFLGGLDVASLIMPYTLLSADDIRAIALAGVPDALRQFGESDVMQGQADGTDVLQFIVRAAKGMLTKSAEVAAKKTAQSESIKNLSGFIGRGLESVSGALSIGSAISKTGKVGNRAYDLLQATPLETTYIIPNATRDSLNATKETKMQDTTTQWKTIDKATFTIKIPEPWKEISSQKKSYFASVFRFEGTDGEFFEVGVDPTPAGLPGSDAVWDLKVNASSDGVVIQAERTVQSEMFNKHGDGMLDINAYAKDGNKNISIQGHVYYFFFGNSQQEDGVNTGTIKEILSSFRAKKEISQIQTSPTTATLTNAIAEKAILQKLKTDNLNWPTTALQYDSARGGYYDIFGKIRGAYQQLENAGLVTVIGAEEPTTVLVNFTTQAEPYAIKGQSGKIQQIVEALPEKVGVKEISTQGVGIGYACSGGCYIVTYTATYQRTPFGQSFSSPSKTTYEATAVIFPAGSCWEVSTALIHTADTKKICL